MPAMRPLSTRLVLGRLRWSSSACRAASSPLAVLLRRLRQLEVSG